MYSDSAASFPGKSGGVFFSGQNTDLIEGAQKGFSRAPLPPPRFAPRRPPRSPPRPPFLAPRAKTGLLLASRTGENPFWAGQPTWKRRARAGFPRGNPGGAKSPAWVFGFRVFSPYGAHFDSWGEDLWFYGSKAPLWISAGSCAAHIKILLLAFFVFCFLTTPLLAEVEKIFYKNFFKKIFYFFFFFFKIIF
jgi:hypothetical protein